MRVALAKPVQIEPRLDLEFALIQLARGLPVKRRRARHMSLSFGAGLSAGCIGRGPCGVSLATGAATLLGFGADALARPFSGAAVSTTFPHSAASSLLSGPRFPMNHTPGAAFGRSTMNSAGAKVLPAMAPASSPEPQ